ncbi:LPXTG cell wall anchor domain-containing protein [Bradyrhizobium sp. UFLA05-112]
MLDKALQLQLPHWLMIAGMFLVIIGTLGMLFARRREPSAERSVDTDN